MKVKIISALEKCFLDQQIWEKKAVIGGSMLKNERYSFQVCYQMDQTKELCNGVRYAVMEVISPIRDRITVRKVQSVPSQLPLYTKQRDYAVLRTQPGLYPDALIPMSDDRIAFMNTLNALWLDVEGDDTVDAGVYPIKLRFRPVHGATGEYRDDMDPVETEFQLEVIDASLPKQTTKVTHWFHCDCLQVYYGTEAFDERHWQIIETFMKIAVKNGINMILTPLFTPPLDTAVGGERPTTQLVGVRKEGSAYFFDFSRLERWIKLCDRVGVEYFEINHMFTQWGANHCPKIMALVEGREKRIFGWESDAAGEEYRDFLNQFIPQFLSFMQSMNGADQRCYFHLSDEPSAQHLDQYVKVHDVLVPLLEGYPVFDALSHVEYFDRGMVQIPVPDVSHIEPFLDREIPERWAYYCCGMAEGTSNRFMALPSYRNRILGAQMYKHGIKGFLHWGYNFYFNQFSYQPVDPWICTDGDGFVPSGDAFVVYPGKDGSCVESLRLKVFHDALQDQRAMELCESLYGKAYVISLIEEGIGELKFNICPQDPECLLRLREKINYAIKAKI